MLTVKETNRQTFTNPNNKNHNNRKRNLIILAFSVIAILLISTTLGISPLEPVFKHLGMLSRASCDEILKDNSVTKINETTYEVSDPKVLQFLQEACRDKYFKLLGRETLVPVAFTVVTKDIAFKVLDNYATKKKIYNDKTIWLLIIPSKGDVDDLFKYQLKLITNFIQVNTDMFDYINANTDDIEESERYLLEDNFVIKITYHNT